MIAGGSCAERIPVMSFRYSFFFLALFLATRLPAAPPEDSLAEKFRRDTAVLASDEMEGRGLGTAGLDRAAVWIEQRLESTGVKPLFGRSYRQPVRIKSGVEMRSGNELAGVAATDWTPLASSKSGAFEGELVFVGYGIESPQIGYQELSGVDLKGKVALMLRYEPQEKDEASPFDGRRPSRWSALRHKVFQAKQRGAVAVVFVTGPLQDEGNDKLPALKNDGPESDAGIAVLQVKTSVAQKWLSGAGIDLAAFQKEVDRDLRPRSRATGIRLRGNVAIDAKYGEASNVGGIIPGKGSLANEYVVIGAHYDHLGWGGDHSMRPNVREIHNGADDNASGTVAVLLAAEQLQRQLRASKNHRGVIVLLFAGEELGLAGSAHFVANPPVAMEKVVAMINLDMVGRLREGALTVLGSDSAPEWKGIIDKAASKSASLKVTSSGDGYGPSDQTSFYASRIPVLHLFTGTHEQYHSPDDDAPTLNAEGGAEIVRFTTDLAQQVAAGESTPRYARLSVPAAQGDSRGYGAYLGTVPDYRAMGETSGGVLLSDVRPGSPAERAGIKGGDRIIEIAGTKISNLYDMTFALQDHRPGETVDVIVQRGGANVTLKATLSERGQRTAPAATPAAPPATPPAAPAPAAPPAANRQADPHAGMPSAAPAPSFYDGRPGKDFVVGAGKPYAKRLEGEKHLADIRQLTFGGENAEAYFSPDGKKLIYQATVKPAACDQQYILDLATGESTLVSSGKGRTTCGYYDWPEADRIIYASTEAAGESCPPPPDRSSGYVWPIYATFDLWESLPDGSNRRRLTDSPGYDAEATWCHRGGKVVFTSTRDGDLELYEMNEAGEVRRLTNTPGYDGGAFYNADCSEIVWRASRPEGAALEEYRSLLQRGLVRPGVMELYVMKTDGSDVRKLTETGKANFGPYFHPDGKRIIYSSNAGASGPREFDLFMVTTEGGQPERITTAESFDGFPMFSPDGQYLVFASNRADPESGETNLFIARWVE
jgi:Tol biopolymer transport system component